MKKILFALSAIGVFAAAALAAGHGVKAEVPFDFAVAGNDLAAGTYTIEEHSQPGILMIRDADGRVKALFLADRAYRNDSGTEPSWVFNRYGDRYFLSRVWGTGEAGTVLRKSKIERELVASSAAGPADQVVLVAAVSR